MLDLSQSLSIPSIATTPNTLHGRYGSGFCLQPHMPGFRTRQRYVDTEIIGSGDSRCWV